MDEKLKDRIVELFDQGWLLEDIAAEVGYSSGRMTQILQERGRSAWNRRYPNAKRWNIDSIWQDYEDGMPLEDILEKYHISCTTFYRQRKKAGVPPRGRRGAPGKKNYQYKHGNGAQRKRRDVILTKQVAALCLGYVVPRRWIIHHIDGDPANNHPENLAVFHDKKEHAEFHQRELKLQRADLPVDASQLVSEIGGILLQSPSHPIVLPHEKGRLDPPESRQSPKTDLPASEPDQGAFDPQ